MHTHAKVRSATRLHSCVNVCVRRPWQSDRSTHTRTHGGHTNTRTQAQIHRCEGGTTYTHTHTHRDKSVFKENANAQKQASQT